MNLANKKNNIEKRAHIRHNCEAVIRWSFFNKKTCFDAKLLNFSENGIYIETSQDLKPGTTIFLQMNIDSSYISNSQAHPRPRSISLGEVKWRIDLSGIDQSCYGIGVRYPFQI